MNDIISEFKIGLSKMRNSPKFALLTEEKWIEFQICYIAKNMGYEYLSCAEKNSYFKKIIEHRI